MDSFGCSLPASVQTPLDPCGVTEDEFICQALKLLPPGALWARGDCTFAEWFKSIAATYYQQWQRICALRIEASPCTAEDTITEWAGIWGETCEGFPDDPDDLRDALCQLIRARGVLTADYIVEQMALAGYIVTDVAVDDAKYPDESVTVSGFSLGVSPLGGALVLGRTDSCEDQYAGIPCATSCCVSDQAGDLAADDPCVILTNRGYCASGCGCDCAGLGSITQGSGYNALINPWTLIVKVDPESPSIDKCLLTDGSILPRGGFLGAISCEIITEPCAIAAIKPAHLQIKYEVC